MTDEIASAPVKGQHLGSDALAAPAAAVAAAVVSSNTVTPRVIPGLTSVTAAASAATKRSRNRKGKTAVSPVIPSQEAAKEDDKDAHVGETSEHVEVGAGAAVVEETIEDDPVRTASTEEAVQKRLRAAAKKLQRIATYEAKTDALNADQRKAIESKPALEANVKELTELLQIIKDEEEVENARLLKIKGLQEKRAAQHARAAVAASKAESQGDLHYLFQFLHLNTLYSQENTGFAPLALPEVVANATSQEVAAVRMLHHIFSTGTPSLDSADRLSKIRSSSSEEVIGGVTYARINELVAGLTSPPSPTVSIETPVEVSSQPAHPADSVISIADGLVEATPSFLQASELSPPPEPVIPIESWADSVEETIPHNVELLAPPPIDSEVSAIAPPTLDWAEEDSNELPSLAGLAPIIPLHNKPSVGAGGNGGHAVGGGRGGAGGPEDDGFQTRPARSNRGHVSGGYGGDRGARRRGDSRGGGRGGDFGGQTRKPYDGSHGGAGGDRGGFQGDTGRGGGYGGGRGRGSAPRGGAHQSNGSGQQSNGGGYAGQDKGTPSAW